MSRIPESGEDRWKKAIDAELRHYTETAELRIVSERRAADILDRWSIGFEFFANDRVLAVGGGTGIVHHLSNADRAVSLDPLNGAVFPAVREDSNAEGVTGVGECLPFPDDSFDVVISANVIDHTADPRRALAEIARVTDSDGVFLFDVNVFRARRWARRIADFLDGPHPHHFDPVDVQEMLLDSFDQVEITSLEEIPFDASPSMFGRTKILVANVVFGIRKVCYVCRIPK